MTHARSKAPAFILDNSLLLLAGTAAAVLWANLDLGSYDAVAHLLHFWVNEVGMSSLRWPRKKSSRRRCRGDHWRRHAAP
jgi:hypothetical protein